MCHRQMSKIRFPGLFWSNLPSSISLLWIKKPSHRQLSWNAFRLSTTITGVWIQARGSLVLFIYIVLIFFSFSPRRRWSNCGAGPRGTAEQSFFGIGRVSRRAPPTAGYTPLASLHAFSPPLFFPARKPEPEVPLCPCEPPNMNWRFTLIVQRAECMPN